MKKNTFHQLFRHQGVVAFIGAAAVSSLCFSLGCKVGPDYCGTPVNTAASYTQIDPEKGVIEQAGGTLNDVADSANWFVHLNDPALVQFTYEAMANNYSLREAAMRIHESRARVGVTQSQYFPQFNADASYRNIQRAGVPGRVDNWNLGTGFAWELDIFGRIERLSEAAMADVAATEELYRNTYIILLADIATSYVDVRMYQQQIEITKANIRTRENTLRLVKSKLEAQTGNQLDTSRAEGSYEAARAELPALETNLRQSLNRLSILVGRPPGYVDHMLATVHPIPEAPESILVGIPAELIRRRPDVRAAEQNIVAQTSRIGVAIADWYPRFSLNGAFGLDAAQMSQLFMGDAISSSFGPAMTWSILTFGRIRSNIELQQYLQQEYILAYQRTILQAAEEVDNSLATYVNEKERFRRLTQAVDSYDLALKLAELRYERGVSDLQPVLDSQREKLTYETQRTVSQANTMRSVIKLYRALGGGWLPTMQVAVMPESQRLPQMEPPLSPPPAPIPMVPRPVEPPPQQEPTARNLAPLPDENKTSHS